MQDEEKTKAQLIDELAVLRRRVAELETAGRDNTERKQAEKELRERHAYLEAVLAAAPDAIITLDPHHRIVTWNPGAERLFGYSQEETVGKDLDDLITSHETFEEAVGLSMTVLNATHVGPLETVRHRKDGSPVDVILAGSPILMEDELIGIVAAYTDITERRRVEQALKENEKRLNLAMEATSDGLWDWNIPTGEAYFSPRYYTMLGYEPYEMPPSYDTWAKLLHPDDRERVIKDINEHIERKSEGFEVEFRLKTKSGGWRCMLGRGRVVERDARGKPIRMVGTHMDLTERVRAQQERERLLAQIQEQARQVQQIMDTVPAGVLLLDAGLHIQLANPAARQALVTLTDTDADAGQPLTHLGPQPLADVLARYADPLPVEITLSTSSPRIFEAQAQPIGEGQARQWVLTLREVTQERELQRQMQVQERLATVGQLAAGIAHDFNNIMASIVLYAGMLLRSPNLSPKEQARLNTIRQQGHRAANLVQQILDFARKSVMERKPLDLIPFLKELEKLLMRTLPETIRLHLDYDHDDYVVNADPTRIQQVVMNLALNARDAMPHGGELRLRLDRFQLSPGQTPPLIDMPPGDWVKLTVSDTGTGIPSDVMPHIFEPFFTTKQVGKGTGLGLAQVYGIIHQHEGHIGVQSQVGQGATFTVYLSALELPGTAPQVSDGKTLIQGHGETILVVEDDPITRAAIAEILQDIGYRILTAVNGQQALTLFSSEVALVISDLVMPEKGGVALHAQLKADHPTVKMIVITGYPLSDGGRTLLEQGVTAWLPKPFSADELARAVQAALG